MRAAFYIIEMQCSRFITLDNEGRIGDTSCPHAATLWTSGASAKNILEQVQKAFPDGQFLIRPTRTHEPNVRVG